MGKPIKPNIEVSSKSVFFGGGLRLLRLRFLRLTAQRRQAHSATLKNSAQSAHGHALGGPASRRRA